MFINEHLFKKKFIHLLRPGLKAFTPELTEPIC